MERLDQDALRVIYRLRAMGHQAYFVGGCVRDLLLDAKPKDFDLATDAHPGEVRAAFRNCRLIGRRFRLAHVYFRDGKVIEVATFRKNPTDVAEDTGEEGDLLITRDNVFGTAEEDAVRRDFTVNGLFYDPATGEVIDYVGGRADLEAHRMATIGDPEIRMREDPVRALRAVRFAARLGFAIAPDTFEAMRRHAGELARCAPARVLEEIFKLLRCGGSARAFALLKACGALPFILPALGAAHERWDEAQRRSFIAHLGALDRLVRSGAVVSEVVLLGALLMHLGSPGLEAEAPAAEALLEELVQTSRLPRKVAEGIRLALQAQRSFREPPRQGSSGRRRRRGRGLAGQHGFTDALQLLQITVEASGLGLEVLNRWRAEAQRTPQGHHDDEGADGDLEAERPTLRADVVRDGDTEAEQSTGAALAGDGVAERPARRTTTPAREGGDGVAERPAGRTTTPAREGGNGAGQPARRSGGARHAEARRGGSRRGAGDALPAGGAGAVLEVRMGGDVDGAEEDDGDEAQVAEVGGRPAGDAAAPGGSKKRRHRGGRRRRRRGAGAPGAGSPPSPPAA